MVQISFVASALRAALLVLVFCDEPARGAVSAQFRHRSQPALRADLAA